MEIITEIYNGIEYSNKYGSKYLQTTKRKGLHHRRLHRQKWFDTYGEIPKGYHIHHKDGNQYNNKIENLELIEGKKHIRMHAYNRIEKDKVWFEKFCKAGQAAAPKWHASEEGIAWHIQHAANFNFGKREYGTHKCDVCNTEFTKKSHHAKFCSNNCKSAFRRKSGVDNVTRKCQGCQTEITFNKYTKVRYCKSCATKNSINALFKARQSL